MRRQPSTQELQLNDTAYVYQADDAELVMWEANFTSRNGDGAGDSEANFGAAIIRIAACKAGGRFLDIGSGHGRIIDWLKPYAATIVGIEPDVARFSSCKNTFRNDANIDVRNVMTHDLIGEGQQRSFDLITASMVLQHVSTRTCQGILDDLRVLLAKDGIAIISTTHFPFERFTYQLDSTPKDKSEFDRYADRSDSHDQGLPVRMFGRASFEAALNAADLDIVAWQQFSYPRPGSVDGLASLYHVAPDDLRDCGISQYALVRLR
jgi:2-polyprenyl-3-methyl-5-hydroxy-6-metoxy-1,4-benzoquinol methylase